VAVPLLLGIAFVAMHLTETALRDTATARANGERQALEGALDRLSHLPVAIADHPDVIALLTASDGASSAALARRVDSYLERVANAANASLLYVIDERGLTRAASNHRTPNSLVGNDYAFRPYFREAMSDGASRYFAIGVTSGEAGNYFSHAVRQGGETLGVVVVKVELESLQRQWQGGDGTLLLLDQYGVSVLASRPAWRFRTLATLGDDARGAFAEQRKYGPHALEPLGGQRETGADGRLRRLVLDGTDWLVAERTLARRDWRLLHLVDRAPVRRDGLVAAATSLLVGGLAAVGVLYVRARRRQRQLALAAREAQRMRELNLRLEGEVAERQRTEEELRAAQGELIRTSRLTALGQMSTAIAHEVNQPLSAIRTFSASARLLIDRERPRDARANLDEIDELTDRLATLTGDLKVFARKPDAVVEGAVGQGLAALHPLVGGAVDLGACIAVAARRLEGPLAEAGARLDIDAPGDAVLVPGSALRIEQVLSNLFANAIDATRDGDGTPVIQVSLGIDFESDEAVLRVRDNGPGLDAEALEHLFDPFFTTKPVGQGVGLGLAIAYGIVQEMGGRLRVRNVDDGGALFSLRLPMHGLRQALAS